MKENKKNQPVFGTAVNTDKKAGQQGAEVLRQFMLDKYKRSRHHDESRKKAFKKMAKELLEAKQIDKGVQQDL